MSTRNEERLFEIVKDGFTYNFVGDSFDDVTICNTAPQVDSEKTIDEPCVVVSTEGGYCWGAMPLKDIIKYTMRNYPELYSRAVQECIVEQPTHQGTDNSCDM